MVFDGEELLPYAARSVRSQVDHIAVTYQSVSCFDNVAHPSLFETIYQLRDEGLVDEVIHYDTDLSLGPRRTS